MRSTRVLDDVDKELGCVSLRPGTTHKEDHSTVRDAELNKRKDPNVVESFGVELYITVRGVVHVVQGSNGILLLSKPHTVLVCSLLHK